MNQDYYISLIYQSLNGDLSASEKKELEQWKAESTDNQLIAKSVQQAWEMGGNFQSEVAVDLDHEFELLNRRKNKAPKVVQMKPRRAYFRYAAVGLILVAAAFVFNNFFNQQPTWELVEATKEEKIELIDGSTVWLKEGSTFEYTAEFGKERRVKLAGEGFFEVAKNPNKRFIVETPTVEVTVLGTSFNVAENAEEVAVFVRTGKVNMCPKGVKNGVDLKPMEKGIYNLANQKLTRLVDAKSNDDAWQSKRLVYDNDRLVDIVKGLGHYYKKELIIDNEAMKTCEFTFVFDDKTFAEVLKTLEQVLGFQTAEEGDFISLLGGFCPGK